MLSLSALITNCKSCCAEVTVSVDPTGTHWLAELAAQPAGHVMQRCKVLPALVTVASTTPLPAFDGGTTPAQEQVRLPLAGCQD